MTTRLYATLSALVLLVVIAVFLIGLKRTPAAGKPTVEFAERLNAWSSSGPTSYSLEIQRLCECDIRPIRVVVRNGAVETAALRDGAIDVPLDDAARRTRVVTIDGLFKHIAAAYRDNAHEIAVQYDSALGYPVSAFIDHDAKVVDDEETYVVSGFIRLPDAG